MSEAATIFPEERQQAILGHLRAQGRVVALDLAREFATSEHTIRRDLRVLAKTGACQRTYGGAILLPSPASGTFTERQERQPEPKAALARVAASLIKQDQFVFLDAGTTNLEIARVLPVDQHLTVATNAPAIALAALDRPGVSVVLIGGMMNALAGAALGARAVRDVQALSVDLLFLGVCALSTEGLSAFDFEDVEFKRVLLSRSRTVAATVTSDKLQTTSPCQITPLEAVHHLILERDADPALLAQLRRLGPSIHQPTA